MKVLLVRPDTSKKSISIRNFMFGEPLGIECVSTILKSLKHDVKFIDLMIDSISKYKKLLKKYKPDVVGITSGCTDIDNVIKTADITKRIEKNIKVIVGGVQCTMTPEAYFNKNIDYVFKSTTYENYKLLMNQIKNNTNEEYYYRFIDDNNNEITLLEKPFIKSLKLSSI